MAIFVPGMPCSLCQRPITATDDVVMFSPFVADCSDPLSVFSDAIAHTSCFVQHPLSTEATKWHDEATRQRESAARVCVVCTKPIADPDDYFGTGLLSRDPATPLFDFNHVHLHRSHAARWIRFEELRRLMDNAQASGSWQGPALVINTTQGEKVRWAMAKVGGSHDYAQSSNPRDEAMSWLTRAILPRLEAAASLLSSEHSREVTTFRGAVGSLTEFDGYDVGIEVEFANGDCVALSVTVGYLATVPRVCASVAWSGGPRRGTDFATTTSGETSADWPVVTAESMLLIERDLPRLVSVLDRAIREYLPDGGGNSS